MVLHAERALSAPPAEGGAQPSPLVVFEGAPLHALYADVVSGCR